MRAIKLIILHCSDSDYEGQTAKWVRKIHVTENGWDDIGYHYFIRKNGVIESGRRLEEVGAHVRGQNSDSIGICLAGRDRFSNHQFESLEALLLTLARVWPEASVHGHSEFDSSKTCPNFKVDRFAYVYKEGKPRWKKLLDSLWKMLLRLLRRS